MSNVLIFTDTEVTIFGQDDDAEACVFEDEYSLNYGIIFNNSTLITGSESS